MPISHETSFYFESHITIDPVIENIKVKHLTTLIKPMGFKLAKLLMQKGEPSNIDSFMTARSKEYDDIVYKTENCVKLLMQNGYTVRRYKVENILMDVRVANI
jgi:hypothetical protein